MTTVAALADTIRKTHDIDTIEAARDVVESFLPQIATDPELWNAETETFTRQGTRVVTCAVSVSYTQGFNSTADDRLLYDIADAQREIDEAKRTVEYHVEVRDKLIRTALKTALSRKDIMTAAGLSRDRLYQIRDGRR